MKTKICAVALAIAAAAPAIADDFTYLSGGLIYQSSNYLDKGTGDILVEGIVVEREDLKKNGFGFYLNGSLGIADYLFVEGRLHHDRIEQQALLGIGGHYPVAQWANLYALAGITEKHVMLSSSKEPLDRALSGIKDGIKPTLELGAKLRVNDAIGARVSYRYALFGHKDDDIEYKHLHEGHLGGYYQVAESCAVEAGYNFTRFLKDVNNHKITVGIRYSF